MADTKISDLTEQTTLSDTDLFVTAQEDVSNKKISYANLKSLFAPDDYITGLVLSNNSVDASNDIDISSGCCMDSTNSNLMKLTSGITKQIDAAWAVGTNAGGLDGTESVAGTPDADTIYNIYLIKRSDTGVVDACFSENGPSTGPSIDGTPIPTAYDYWRWLGWVRTDSTPAIIAANWMGNGNQLEMWFKARQELATGLTATSYTAQSVTGYIPSGTVCDALFGAIGTTTSGAYVHLSSDGVNAKTIFYAYPSSPSVGSTDELYGIVYSSPVFIPIISDQVYYKLTGANATTLLLRAVRYWR